MTGWQDSEPVSDGVRICAQCWWLQDVDTFESFEVDGWPCLKCMYRPADGLQAPHMGCAFGMPTVIVALLT
jgi:hypothetical protein